MKLLFAIKSLTTSVGGAERVFTHLVNALHDRGHLISIMTYDSASTTEHFSFHPGISKIRLGLGFPGHPATLMETICRIQAVRRTVKDVAPDLVIAFMHSMFIPLGIALLGTRFPIIACEHTVWAHYRSRWLERLLLRLVPFISKTIIVTSNTAKAGFPPELQRAMEVINNPVMNVMNSRADPRGVSSSRKILLSVGRLSIEKDHLTLIDAFSLLAKDFPDWDLRIVGEGDQRASLEERVRSLNLESRIALPGATPNISKEFLHAQLFVIPSRYESFGLATAEALSFGLPVVGFSDCPGTNELVTQNQNGILINSQDRVANLATGLRQLMDNPDVRFHLGQAGPASVTQFSPDKIVGQWETLAVRYA